MFFINSTLIFLMRNFQVKYQESSIGFDNLAHLQSSENKCNFFLIRVTSVNEIWQCLAMAFVGSMDRESSQQLQMWFSEHFFAPKLAA